MSPKWLIVMAMQITGWMLLASNVTNTYEFGLLPVVFFVIGIFATVVPVERYAFLKPKGDKTNGL